MSHDPVWSGADDIEPTFVSPEAVEPAAAEDLSRGLLNAEVVEMTSRIGEWEDLEERLDSLADALEPLLDIISTTTFGDRPDVVAAVAVIDEALRKAGR